jgi:hypothetical protein
MAPVWDDIALELAIIERQLHARVLAKIQAEQLGLAFRNLCEGQKPLEGPLEAPPLAPGFPTPDQV